MTACTAIMECRHKIAFVSTLPIEKLLPWFPVCAFHFFPLFRFEFWFILLSFFLFFLFSAFIQGWVLAAATNRWLQPLLLRTTWSADRGKKNPQAVNELPSFRSVKGVYKLDPFVRALLCSLSLLLPPCLLLPPLSLLILAPSPPSRPSSCSSIFSLYLPASRSSSSVAGAALSGFGSEQHLLSARFMFRISHLMRTKEINWWFKPNETSVKLTGLINWNK